MKRIKPGRGPSAMGAVGALFAIVFGVIWTMFTFKMSGGMASGMGMGPISFFPIFGLIFIGIGIVQFIYNLKNARGKNRMSLYDITDDQEEGDIFEQMVQRESNQYCPYCGEKMKEGFKFCPDCGKKV